MQAPPGRPPTDDRSRRRRRVHALDVAAEDEADGDDEPPETLSGVEQELDTDVSVHAFARSPHRKIKPGECRGCRTKPSPPHRIYDCPKLQDHFRADGNACERCHNAYFACLNHSTEQCTNPRSSSTAKDKY